MLVAMPGIRNSDVMGVLNPTYFRIARQPTKVALRRVDESVNLDVQTLRRHEGVGRVQCAETRS